MKTVGRHDPSGITKVVASLVIKLSHLTTAVWLDFPDGTKAPKGGTFCNFQTISAFGAEENMASFGHCSTAFCFFLVFFAACTLTPVSAGNLTITCTPNPCPKSLPYNSSLSLLVDYSPTATNTALRNLTVSYTLTYIPVGQTQPQTVSYSNTSRPTSEKNITLQISPSTQLNLTTPLQSNGQLRTRFLYTEVFQHDGSFAGAATEDGAEFVVLGVNANGAEGTTPTPSAPGSGPSTATATPPRSVLVLGSAAMPTARAGEAVKALGSAVAAGMAGMFLL
ncbi:hypothetical protein SpCBS45565_g01346 [Spizellomyces sp. 'palustris']|nr:hypothetical protein SpCBS45565_g01346 [Spizellomyces sp. 'palustris']